MSRPADNFEVRVVSWFYKDLVSALELIERSGYQAKAWSVEDGALVFHWYKEKGTTRFPSRLKLKAMARMIWDWLHEQEYPREPDIDGDCSKGFTIVSGGEERSRYEYIKVKPTWLMHHK